MSQLHSLRSVSILRYVMTLMVFIPFVTYAQNDRVNSNIPVIGDHILWSLDQATGWTKNREGQWIEGKNKIHQAAMSVGNKTVWEKEANALGKDNFIRYEVRDIKISGIDFLLFTKIMNYGYWKYPDTRYGWNPQSRVYYAVIKKKETTTEANYFDPAALDYRTKCYFLGFMPFKEDYLTKIALQLNKDDAENANYRTYGITPTLDVRYKALPDNKGCRFHIYAGGINKGKIDMLPKDSDERLVNVFTDFYFECPKDKFEGLLKLIKS